MFSTIVFNQRFLKLLSKLALILEKRCNIKSLKNLARFSDRYNPTLLWHGLSKTAPKSNRFLNLRF